MSEHTCDSMAPRGVCEPCWEGGIAEGRRLERGRYREAWAYWGDQKHTLLHLREAEKLPQRIRILIPLEDGG